VRIEELTTTIDHVPVFYRVAGAAARDPEVDLVRGSGAGEASAPESVIYLHGAGMSSDIWRPFLERTGGLAVDLIGFGRSGKGGHLDYTPEGLANFVERWLEHAGVQELGLVGHGWGGVIALLLAARQPERVSRLVLIDPIPLVGGFQWPRMVGLWRRPLIGELVMGAIPRWLFRRQLRAGVVDAEAWSRAELDAAWEQFDQGTQRALIRLHRAAGDSRLAELGSRLGSVRAATLVVWGEEDPWADPRFAEPLAAALPQATVERVPRAGHWPWRDEARVVERVAEFLGR
jgi:pimeloyl-ACP methyl ester carboxylesterase